MLLASVQGALLPFAIAYAGGCGLVGALGLAGGGCHSPP